MNSHYRQASRWLFLTVFFMAATLAEAAGSANPMDLPYTPPMDMPLMDKTSPASSDLYGRVVKTMDAGGYTYVQLDSGEQKVWAAGPITPIKVGDAVKVSTNMPMQHFYSKALKQDFDLVYFTNTITVAGAHTMASTAQDPHHTQAPLTSSTPLASIKKAKNGKTIAEIYKERKQLAGKQVRVRGKVIKYFGNIYGKNWLHIQDSSTGQNLLVITGDNSKRDVVLVEGTVVLNKDNGIGHVYEVALDNAKLLDK
jgi:hypothetical protein